MPIVRSCSYPGCSTLTMGEVCLEHELEPLVEPPRSLEDALEAVRSRGPFGPIGATAPPSP